MERSLPSKLLLALLMLAPALEAQKLDGPCEDRRRRLRSSPLVLPSCRGGAAVVVPAAELDVAKGLRRPSGGLTLPAPESDHPLQPGALAPPPAAAVLQREQLAPPSPTADAPPHYHRKGAPARWPADVLGVIRDAIVRYVLGA